MATRKASEWGGGGGGGGERARNRLQSTPQHFRNLPFPIMCDEHGFDVNSQPIIERLV